MMEPFLQDIEVVCLAVNVPGPVAAARLAALGAHVTKIEPPAGDQLKAAAPHWYNELISSQSVRTLDLKQEAGRRDLDLLLEKSRLLITSFRPSALRRMGLAWETLHTRHPQVCMINIVGYPPPQEELAGHDLNYQAKLGLLSPPDLPITLHADLAGAERSVSAALALLLQFERTGKAACATVSLYDALQDFTGPLIAGLTKAGGWLRGGFAFYGLYQSADGWISLAALERSFIERLVTELKLTSVSGDPATRSELARVFRTRSASEWEKWAAERDLPIAAVNQNPPQRH